MKRKPNKDAAAWLDTTKPVDMDGKVPLGEIESGFEAEKRRRKFREPITPELVEGLIRQVIEKEKRKRGGE